MNGILTPDQGDTLVGQGNQDARSRAMNAGILGAAEGILTAPNLMSAMGQGFGGFNRGYNASLVANRPKVTTLANGAFSQVTMPDGSTKIIGNAQVADFLKQQAAAQQFSKAQLAILQGQIGAQRTGAGSDITAAREAAPALNSTNMSIDSFNKALEVVKAQSDPNDPAAVLTVPFTNIKIPKAQLQGMAPTMAGLFGGDQAASNKFLQGLKVDQTLLNTALTKGAISNAEMALFASPIPSLTDNREKVWKPYLEARIPVLQKLQQFYQQQVQAGQTAASGATITGAPSTSQAAPAAAPQAPAPQVSTTGAPVLNNANPVTIASEQEYDALPSGTQFVGPDGQIRQKP